MKKFALLFAAALVAVPAASADHEPWDPKHPLVDGVSLHGLNTRGWIYVVKRRPSGEAISQENAEVIARTFVQDLHGTCTLQKPDEGADNWKVQFSCSKPFIPPPPFAAPPPLKPPPRAH